MSRCRRCHRSDICVCAIRDAIRAADTASAIADTEAAIDILLTAVTQATLEYSGATRLHVLCVLARACGLLAASLPHARVLDIRDRLDETMRLALARPGETVH